MIAYQLDDQNQRCKEVTVSLENGRWTSDHYLKIITFHFDSFEIFEPYRYFPDWCYKTNPDIVDSDCKIDAVEIDFRFHEDKSLTVSGRVWLPYLDTHVTHDLRVQISKVEIAQILSHYFATSPEQIGHRITHLQSLYWRFVEWCTNYFSVSLEKLDIEKQECYVSALYDAFRNLSSNNPFIPSEPFNSGKAMIHWAEHGDDGLYSVDHYLFMDKDGRVFHYCENAGAMFDEVF